MSKIHVFPYSRRKNTPAAAMPQVNDTVKKNRALDLIKFSNELEEAYAKKFINEKLDIIIEQKYNDEYMIGHTSNFLQVLLPLDLKLIGSHIDIIIDKVIDNKVYGRIDE